VEDIPRSIKFYTEKLGFTVNEKTRDNDEYASVECDDAIIDLYGKGTARQLRQEKETGLVHIALKVKDFDATYEELIRRGIEFHIKAFFQPKSGRKIAFFKDPDGNILHITT
jgi:catechol 2,3-dioxygenase-like lactoylglutathione lyase family enzyme